MRLELYETRDRAYGIWHRAPSIRRYLCSEQAESLTMVDLDSVLFTEYDNAGKVPLALVEVARDVGQEKPAPAANPSNPNWDDIESFRVRRMWPRPEAGWRILTPGQWARALVQIRGWQMRRFEAREAANDDRY
ncbi:hypothetical protein PWP93_04775 [Paraburkholderia sp. A1RI-2L]|uniref:hypothetical protein n=1 Tax=Paraburkholderia sp. A1RI-2L TaxID=3028367 RepID=UPI003B800AEA